MLICFSALVHKLIIRTIISFSCLIDSPNTGGFTYGLLLIDGPIIKIADVLMQIHFKTIYCDPNFTAYSSQKSWRTNLIARRSSQSEFVKSCFRKRTSEWVGFQ